MKPFHVRSIALKCFGDLDCEFARGCQHQHLRCRRQRGDRRRGLDPVHDGHPQVHQHDVDVVLAQRRQRLATVGRLGHHLEVVGTASSPERAEQISRVAAQTFEAQVVTDQNAAEIPEDNRVVITTIDEKAAAAVEGSNPAIPVVVTFLGVFLLFVAAAYIIAGSKASRERKRAILDLEKELRGVRDAAITDPLTGLANRRYLWHFLPYELLRIERRQSSLAVIMMVLSEYFSSTSGVGYVLLISKNTFEMAPMWAAIVLIGLLGYLLNVLFLVFERRALAWHRGWRAATPQ